MITVSVIQDHYTAHPKPLDETLPTASLRRECARFLEESLAPQIDLARQAIRAGTDLIVFREDCNGAGNLGQPRLDRPDLLALMSEPIPGGPTSDRLTGLAREGSCFVLGCFMEKDENHLYNTAVLFDPNGRVVGKYRKTHLPPIEKLLVTAGNNLPVVQTEIGRIGMLICYDMMTPEVMRCLALKGADMILWPSLGYGWWQESGDFTVRSRAHDNQVYLLGALPTNSCIVNPYGDLVVSARDERLAILRAEIEPGRDPLQDPYHHNTYMTQTPSLRERHLFERQPHLYGLLVEPEPELMQRYPDTHMHDLARDKVSAFEHYRQGLNRLHWKTRPE
jgi:predicted amidohydrolase